MFDRDAIARAKALREAWEAGTLRAFLDRQPESRPLAMVNPEIVSLEGKTTYSEGCLSVPGEAEDVERAAFATVRYLDEQGAEHQVAPTWPQRRLAPFSRDTRP